MSTSPTPKVSVIILAFNNGDSIAGAIDSVLAQKCSFPFEIVIGDDDSSDSTRAICEEYADKYPAIIKLMPKAPNKGIVDNYFDCLEACSGEYVTDCAADDLWPIPDRLQQQVDFLDANPEYVVVMSDWIIRAGKNERLSSHLSGFQVFTKNLKGPDMMTRTLNVTRDFPLLSAMLFRRAPIAHILESSPELLRRKDWRCEDLPVIVTLASLGDFAYLPITASVYIQNPAGQTNTTDKEKLFDFYLATTRCMLDLAQIHNIPLSSINDAIQTRFNYLASLMIALRDSTRRKQLIELASRAKPHLLPKTRLYFLLTSTPLTWRLLNLHFK